MFGTIGHARPKPGHEAEIAALMDDWIRTIRPLISGKFLSLSGRPKDRPGEMVFVALAQDEATYRNLAALPEQDAWYRKLVTHLEGEPTWEDVELTIDLED
jgi:hypothetical protein